MESNKSKRRHIPFYGIAKTANALIEASDATELKREVRRYMETTRKALAGNIINIDVSSFDPENMDAIGKVICEINGKEIEVPFIVNCGAMKPVDIAVNEDKLIPTFDEYLEKFIEEENAGSKDYGVARSPSITETGSEYRFEREEEIPTFRKISALRKIAEETGITLGNRSDYLIFNDENNRSNKIASLFVENASIIKGHMPNHYDIKALCLDKNGELVVVEEQDIPAERVKKLKDEVALNKIAFNTSRIDPTPDALGSNRSETMPSNEPDLPEGYQYISKMVDEGRDVRREDMSLQEYLKKDYPDASKFPSIDRATVVEDIVDNVFDTNNMSCVLGRLDARTDTEKDQQESSEHYVDSDTYLKNILYIGRLTCHTRKSDKDSYRNTVMPYYVDNVRDIDKGGAPKYLLYAYTNKDDKIRVSLPYQIESSYNLKIIGEDTTVRVNKLQRFPTKAGICFIENLGNTEIVKLSERKLQEFGIHEGGGVSYYAIPDSYKKYYADDVVYVERDIKKNLLNKVVDVDYTKEAKLDVSYATNGNANIAIKGAGYDYNYSNLPKEAAGLYLDYFTNGAVKIADISGESSYKLTPYRIREIRNVNNVGAGEWLKLAKFLNDGNDLPLISKEALEKVGDIGELAGNLIGLEFLHDDVDVAEQYLKNIVFQIPNIIDKLGRLLLLSRLNKADISEGILTKAVEALGRLHCEVS